MALFGTISPTNTFGFRNRIINGDMKIDQRNAGSSINSTAGSTVRPVDRFFVDNFGSGTVACVRSTTAPPGFSNSLSLTVSSPDTPASGDYLLLSQMIEGFNAADLNWGTANAKPITLSFWIRSSVTGVYGAGIRGASPFQSYPFSYTISSANTWEYKTVTIPGPTSGTFDTTNGAAFQVMFDLGSGTDFSGTANTWQSGSDWRVSGTLSWVSNSGATLFITGIQIESGSTNTDFDLRPYGTELTLCQRYLETSYEPGFGVGTTNNPTGSVCWFAATTANYNNQRVEFSVTKRSAPSVTVYNTATGTANQIRRNDINANVSAGASGVSSTGFFGYVNNVSTSTNETLSFHYIASSEL